MQHKSFKRQSSPHARGDGPFGALPEWAQGLFSPRAWGWSEIRAATGCREIVLPTRVGMVRLRGPVGPPQ